MTGSKLCRAGKRSAPPISRCRRAARRFKPHESIWTRYGASNTKWDCEAVRGHGEIGDGEGYPHRCLRSEPAPRHRFTGESIEVMPEKFMTSIDVIDFYTTLENLGIE